MSTDDEFSKNEQRHTDVRNDLNTDFVIVPESDRVQGLIRARAEAEIAEASQHVHSHYKNAKKMIGKSQYANAIEQLDSAIGYKSNAVALYAERGYCNYRLENYEEALNDCNKAIQLDSENITGTNVYNTRGLERMALDDLEGSIKDFDDTFNIKSGSESNCF